MNFDQLLKGNRIAKEIENCKANIIAANYTQSEKVAIRETHLNVNGIEGGIEVPASLFRIIGKLILSEYQTKLIDLENELQSL